MLKVLPKTDPNDTGHDLNGYNAINNNEPFCIHMNLHLIETFQIDK